ncbi:hypothetical protein [Limnoglobus roseus]|uniref:Uncharacterized protein n=1 Tax=Limnoglobus roseus TaxID=2598579 RepID=A0A5C1A7K0_9BACT|nr:hypothetical protein [Limnoglobus roseus]QEL13966.1 hypothetical protein PX52LOC_00826 [Limnoglobus roseus]
MWHRIFGHSLDSPSPAALAENLHALGIGVEPHFRGDDLGWTRGELLLPGGGTPILLERYLTEEDDLRDMLNTFAAELETMTHSPNNVKLMEHVINTKQLVTLRKPIDHADESRLDATVQAVVQFLAAGTGGVYQIDGKGWFATDGTLLVQEY